MPKENSFRVGSAVMAKWPGSKLWFKSKILQILDDGFKVRYSDGTEEEVPAKDVLSEAYFNRQRSRSRSRSPGRRRSRSPSRKSSPSRLQQRKSRSPGRPKIAQEKKEVVETPKSRVQEKRSETKIISKTETITTKKEEHTYSTRAQTRSGKQTLELPVEIKSGKVPKTTDFESGGPIGTFFMIFVLPLLTYYLYFICLPESCKFTLHPPFSTNWRDYYDQESYLLFVGFLLFQVLLGFLPVGRTVLGMPQRSGKRLPYRLNGWFAFLVTFATFGSMVYYKCPVTRILDNMVPFMTISLLLSFFVSIALYIKARQARNSELSPGGNSGNIVYDFYMGHELSPRIAGVDLKLCMIHTGLFTWIIINFACLVKVWTDFPENPPWNLIVLTVFQFVYVFDFVLYESCYLTTLDCNNIGLGFKDVYVVFGFIPVVFSLQARYLTDHATPFPDYCLIPVALLFSLGYFIYRMSNSEKNAYRQNPYNSSLQTIPTDSGKRLIVSGWWGFVRRPNYLGDILMNFSWAFCTGFYSFVPYFYPMFLILILVIRERRDSSRCRQNYGAAWDKYCTIVRYRIIPYVY